MQGQNNQGEPSNKNGGENIKEQQQRESPRSSRSRSYSSSHSDDSRSDSGRSRSSSSSEKDKHGQQKQDGQNQGKKQGEFQQPQRKIRYKYCCKVCKHTDPSKKACVCVVPRSQRRTEIGDQGCQTCGCNGCSKEDFISRGEDPQYKPGQKKYKRINKEKDKDFSQFQARNGCCRKCMKAFSKSNKSCLCQVPENVRNTRLPSSGCKICGCFGCNPQDKKDPRNHKASRKQRQRSRSRDKRKKYARSLSQQSQPREYIDPKTMNFFNVEKSVIGGMIMNQYRIDPALLGFGIPQRTHSYIIGKPK